MLDFLGSLISREVTHLFVDKLRDGVPHDEYKVNLKNYNAAPLEISCTLSKELMMIMYIISGYAVYAPNL
jgi:hypothetical protein